MVEHPPWRGLAARLEQQGATKDGVSPRAPCNASETPQPPQPRSAPQAAGPSLARDPYHGFSQLLQSFSHLLHGPTQEAQPELAAVTYNGTDQKVQKRLEKIHSKKRLRAFHDAWRDLQQSPMDLHAREHLARLYARRMEASRLTESDQQKFHDCVEIGHRALELDPSSCAAYEQLGIAYSIVQAPLAEAKRCVDQTVRLGRISPLAVESQESDSPQVAEPFKPSANFYFVYWRLFRGDPSRRRQAAWALERYQESDQSQRSFDGKLKDLLLLERQVGSYA